MSDQKCVFLVDTQADISVLKCRCINDFSEIDQGETIDIKGVTDGIIESLGTIDVNLNHDGLAIPQLFHVVPDEFNIGADGIIGKDFLKNYKCNLSYEKMLLSFVYDDNRVEIPLHDGPDADTIVLPARCEIARQVRLQTGGKEPRLVDSQEIGNGVMIARTIVNTQNPIVRIINTTSRVQILKITSVSSKSLENYNIYTIDEIKKNKSRTQQLLKEISKNTPENYQNKILPLCSEFSDIFALESDKMTVNNFYTQRFRVKDDSPVYVKNYRLPFSQREEIARQVEKLTKNDLIEPSCAEFNSPILLVPKKSSNDSKKWRLCIDYRLVNRKLVADKYPLPRIEDILDGLGRAKHFSVIDLFSGFHQIPISEESRDITSFSTPDGSFRWKVVPFGLNVSPNSFARMMAIAFSGIPAGTAFLYIDDIIVIGCSESHHLNNLRRVFETLRKYNLKINPYKCNFFRREVTFLGHKCSESGISPDNSKLEAIAKYPEPTDKDSVKRFVAFANYYRKFIKNFAILAQPLNHLTRKSVVFRWGEEARNAFTAIRNALNSPTILAYPDFSKEFTLTVDACMRGCGSVLSQIQSDGTEKPISFASRAFNKSERNKPIIELELLAIYYAIIHYKPYLYGTNFLVRTDHKPLIYLFCLKNPTQRLLRVRLELEEYKFDIEYIPGGKNVVADALSRMSFDEIKECLQNDAHVRVTTRSMSRKKNANETNQKESDMKIQNLSVYEDKNSPLTRKSPKLIMKHNFIEARKNKKSLFQIDLSVMVRDGKLSLEKFFSQLQVKATEQKIDIFQLPLDSAIFDLCSIEQFKKTGQEILTFTKVALTNAIKRVVSKEEQQKLVSNYHKDELMGGHCGRNRLYAKLRSKFFWKGMSKDVASTIRTCPKCQLTKINTHTKEKMEITATPQRAFDVVIVDTIGPLSKSICGNQYAVTLMCDLTKHLTIVPIPNKEAKTVAKAIFENFILVFGVMKNMRTDLGTEYKNQIFDELGRLLKFKHDFSTPYHHQTVGTVERNHRVLNAYLRSYLIENRDDWDVYAKYFQFCYNTTPNSSNKFNFTPFELVFGHEANLPMEKFEAIEPIYDIENYVKELKFRLQTTNTRTKKILEKYKEKMKELYDRNVKEINVRIGDKIKVRNDAGHKLSNAYKGPYIITEIKHPNVTAIGLDNKIVEIHKNRIQKFED